MVGRGEFAYLVAENILSEDIVSAKVYAILIWALVLAVIIGPVLFKIVLDLAFKDKIRTGIKCFEINASGQHHNNIHFELVDTLHHLQLDVLEANVETDGQVDTCKFIVSCAGNDDLDRDMITEIRKDIIEALNDPEAQVNLASHDQDLAYADRNVVEVRVMSQHHPTILPQILDLFLKLKLEVLKVHTEDHLDVDTDIFFLQQTEDESVDLAVIRYGLRDIFHQHNEKCEVMVKRVDSDKMHAIKASNNTGKVRRGDSAARKLLDAQGEGYDIKFSIVEDTHPAFLRDVCQCISDLDLDVTGIDFEELQANTGVNGSSCTHVQGVISTRDLRVLQDDHKRSDLQDNQRISEIREQLADCTTKSANFRVEKKSNELETPHSQGSPNTKRSSDKGKKRRSNQSIKWTKRLTAIGCDGLEIPGARNNLKDSFSKSKSAHSRPVQMSSLSSINRSSSVGNLNHRPIFKNSHSHSGVVNRSEIDRSFKRHHHSMDNLNRDSISGGNTQVYKNYKNLSTDNLGVNNF
eukprot:UN32948